MPIPEMFLDSEGRINRKLPGVGTRDVTELCLRMVVDHLVDQCDRNRVKRVKAVVQDRIGREWVLLLADPYSYPDATK
jgi:hypothetical protein